MSEIEKLAEQLYPLNEYDGVMGPVSRQITRQRVNTRRSDFKAGAAAVIELIRERMPGHIHTLLPSEYARGFNAYRSEILKLLDTIK